MVMNEMEVIRCIAQYSTVSEQLVEEHPLIGINLLAFQKELSVTEKNHVLLLIKNWFNTGYLRKYLDNEPTLNFKKFRYFLSAQPI